MGEPGSLTCPDCGASMVMVADVHAYTCKRCGRGVSGEYLRSGGLGP